MALSQLWWDLSEIIEIDEWSILIRDLQGRNALFSCLQYITCKSLKIDDLRMKNVLRWDFFKPCVWMCKFFYILMHSFDQAPVFPDLKTIDLGGL